MLRPIGRELQSELGVLWLAAVRLRSVLRWAGGGVQRARGLLRRAVVLVELLLQAAGQLLWGELGMLQQLLPKRHLRRALSCRSI